MWLLGKVLFLFSEELCVCVLGGGATPSQRWADPNVVIVRRRYQVCRRLRWQQVPPAGTLQRVPSLALRLQIEVAQEQHLQERPRDFIL
jgi:hypothetical protein